MKNRVFIAGVPVDPITFVEALLAAAGFFEDGGQHFVVTPNPEMAVLASKDRDFAATLKSADLALCDGFGLKLFAPLFGARVPETIHGTDFALALALMCQRKGFSLYLLGGEGETAARAAETLKQLFKNLKIAGAESGGAIEYRDGRWHQDPALVARAAAAKPDLLFVALGHGKQERWIRDHLKQLPTVKLAIGIGGAFNYYAGASKRPPAWMRKAHLEWLWRLVREPRRFRRIITATVVFPLLALKKRLFQVN